MLTKLGRLGYAIGEEPAEFAAAEIDPDSDRGADSFARRKRIEW